MPIARIAGENAGGGIAFLVSAGIVYEIIAAACSSPQTTHINAKTRAPTLMLWVHIGLIQAAGFVAVAAYFDRAHRKEIIAGGVSAGVLMYGQYLYAMSKGLEDKSPGTEDTPAQSTMLMWGNPT